MGWPLPTTVPGIISGMHIFCRWDLTALAELAAALAPGRYHSKAALALQEVLLKVLSED